MTAASAALHLESVSKTFPGQRVLADVNIEILPGQIHGLIGQNGSGKSTLIKLISGFHQPDPGFQAWLAGRPVTLGHLSEDEQRQIHVVHQSLALLPGLTVLENMGLDHLIGKRGLRWISPTDERHRAMTTLSALGVTLDPDKNVEDLSPFDQTIVALARALSAIEKGTALLILDEPTAALGRSETARLFEVLRTLRDRRIGILYVSHALEEIVALCDHVTVLRDGRVAMSVEINEVSQDDLVQGMLGHALVTGNDVEEPTVQSAESLARGSSPVPTLNVSGLTTGVLRGIDLTVNSGEVVGVTGLVGSGYDDLLRLLFGLSTLREGSIALLGEPYCPGSPRAAMRAGIAYVPAERDSQGLIGEFSAIENLGLPAPNRHFKDGRMQPHKERASAVEWMQRAGVVPLRPDRRADLFSGGNAQKIMLAKWLALGPKLLLVNEPTQAVDVGAKASIRRLMRDEAALTGCAVLAASHEPNELIDLCDRILVFQGGQVVSELAGADVTPHAVYEAAHGARPFHNDEAPDG